VPDNVYAAKRKGLRSFGVLGLAANATALQAAIAPLPFAFRSQCRFDFSKRQTIHHVVFSEPALACDADSKPQILQALCAMSVRINHAFNALLFGQWPPAPVEVKPLWRGIEFNPCASARGSVEDRGYVNLIRIAF